MVFDAPPPSQGELRFGLFGFPVRIHPMFWLVSVLLGPLGNMPPVYSFLWVAAVLVGIVVHELGHALAMRQYGFWPSIVLYGFGGLTSYGPASSGSRRPGPWGQIFISAAGPGAGFLLAGGLVGAIFLAGYGDYLRFYGPIRFLQVVPEMLVNRAWLESRVIYGVEFLNFLMQISVYWGLFNLLPIFPLDGGQIAQQVFLMANPRDAMRQTLILSILVAGSFAAAAALRWHSIYLAIFFGYLAYSAYSMLPFYNSRGRWM